MYECIISWQQSSRKSAWNLRKMTVGAEQDITYLQPLFTNIPLYPHTASRHKGKDRHTTGTLSLLKKKNHVNIHFTFELLRAAQLHHPSGDYSHRQKAIYFRNNFHLCCNEHLSAFVHLQLQQSCVSNSSWALALTGVMPGSFEFCGRSICSFCNFFEWSLSGEASYSKYTKFPEKGDSCLQFVGHILLLTPINVE